MASIYNKLNKIQDGNNGNTFSSKKLKTLSKSFMFNDSVIKNSEAVGTIEQELLGNVSTNGNKYDVDNNDLLNFTLSDTFVKKNIPFFDQNYQLKRSKLRKYSTQDEIEQILDIMCNELIVYDEKKYFGNIEWDEDLNIKNKARKDILELLSGNYKKVYRMLGFKKNDNAWKLMKKFLVEGYLAFEIIYSKDIKNIIGFKEIDPLTLTPTVFKEDKKLGWIQFKDDAKNKRNLKDQQIIFISFSSINTESRVSYLERIIRTFNILRIMEQSRIIWSVVNASYKTKFIIPVGGKSKNSAKQTLQSLMQSYRENIDFDSESGEMMINGKAMMPFSKEYWIPEGTSGSPQIENVGGDGGIDLSDIDQLEYFRKKLISISRIPKNRFEQDDSPTWESSPESYTRTEIFFERYLTQIRSMFEEIVIKPTVIQTLLDMPELNGDKNFVDDVYLDWAKYDVFEEMKEKELFKLRVEMVADAKESLVDMDDEGNEHSFFSNEFLVRKFLKMSEEDLKLNAKYKLKEEEELEDKVDDIDVDKEDDSNENLEMV